MRILRAQKRDFFAFDVSCAGDHKHQKMENTLQVCSHVATGHEFNATRKNKRRALANCVEMSLFRFMS
jgi:hypothetical protein